MNLCVGLISILSYIVRLLSSYGLALLSCWVAFLLDFLLMLFFIALHNLSNGVQSLYMQELDKHVYLFKFSHTSNKHRKPETRIHTHARTHFSSRDKKQFQSGKVTRASCNILCSIILLQLIRTIDKLGCKFLCTRKKRA